jgi:ABC-type transport system involved in multi-copper enzyme maturation permease subunit
MSAGRIEMHKNRWHSINIIQKRASQSKLWSLGVFVTMTIALMISSILLINGMRFIETNLLMVEKQVLLVPVLTNGILISLYLALLAAIGFSRELDKGTLETLLYGPVNELTFIIGSFLAYLKVFTITLIITLIWSNLCVWILNLSFRLDVLGLLIASLFMTAELIALGLFSAAWGGKTRNALIYLVLGILLLGGVQIADFIVSGLVQLTTSTASDPMIVVRDILASINGITRWFSPFALGLHSMELIIEQSYTQYFLNIGLMILETIFLIGGSIVLLKKKGVRGMS